MLSAQNQKSQDFIQDQYCDCQLLCSYGYIYTKIELNTGHTYTQVKHVCNIPAIVNKQFSCLFIFI